MRMGWRQVQRLPVGWRMRTYLWHVLKNLPLYLKWLPTEVPMATPGPIPKGRGEDQEPSTSCPVRVSARTTGWQASLRWPNKLAMRIQHSQHGWRIESAPHVLTHSPALARPYDLPYSTMGQISVPGQVSRLLFLAYYDTGVKEVEAWNLKGASCLLCTVLLQQGEPPGPLESQVPSGPSSWRQTTLYHRKSPAFGGYPAMETRVRLPATKSHFAQRSKSVRSNGKLKPSEYGGVGSRRARA